MFLVSLLEVILKKQELAADDVWALWELLTSPFHLLHHQCGTHFDYRWRGRMNEAQRDITSDLDATLGLFSLIASTCMVALCVGWSAMIHYRTFRSQENPYALEFLSTEKIKMFGELPGRVHVGMTIDAFEQFDIARGTFRAIGVLWFRFDPTLVALEELDKVQIDNGTILQRGRPFTQMVNEYLFVQYEVHIEFYCPLDYRMYPDDDHRLYIVLTHPSLTPGELVFESSSSDFLVRTNLTNDAWVVQRSYVDTGYINSSALTSFHTMANGHPAIVFGIDVLRNSFNPFLVFIIPLVMLFMLALSAYTVPLYYWGCRIGLTVSAILGSIVVRLLLIPLMPKISYSTFTDYIFFIFLGGYIAIFLINIYSLRSRTRFVRLLSWGIACVVGLCSVLVWHII